jgi:hypothetical protein
MFQLQLIFCSIMTNGTVDYLTTHTSPSPLRRENYKKWCTPLAAASDKVHQLFAQGRWSSPSCNNVAPMTNLCLGRATTRSRGKKYHI